MLNSFTDLVLLIGTNPLPNYVIAKYFLKSNKQLERIWLICSGGTEKHEETIDLACNIKEVIQKEFDFKAIEEVPLSDIGSVPRIRRDLSQNFSSRASDKSVFHLNYTGGTKSMAVQSYKFFENFGRPCSFSYLDGRDYRLKYDEELQGVSGDLRYEIGLSLEDLIALHGYQKKEPQETFSYKETVQKFAELIEQDSLKDYLIWKQKTIREIYYDKEGKFIETINLFYKHNDLSNNERIDGLKQRFSTETPDYVLELLTIFPKEKSILDDSSNLWIPDKSVTKKEFKERIKPTVKEFIDGKWLEAYVYDVITRSVKNDRELKELYEKGQITIENNWKIKKQDNDKDFELDVILLNGYQVCGISCTTSYKELECKNKGFEVIHRVRQIGGEEARAVLVTCLNREEKDVDGFYKDLKDQTGSRSHEFVVVGLQELKPNRLWDKISNHLWRDI